MNSWQNSQVMPLTEDGGERGEDMNLYAIHCKVLKLSEQ